MSAQDASTHHRLPWAEAGLTEREAAAHLLARLTYGARPGEVDHLVSVGLENWVAGQLTGDLPGATLEARLAGLPLLHLSEAELSVRFTQGSFALERAIAAGLVTRADYSGQNGEVRRADALATLEGFVEEEGLGTRQELVHQLRSQKILRALSSESQLVELLTELWFNHFNVAISRPECLPHVPSYESAIRARVLGPFRDLLGAAAEHPALLLYLDNARSVAEPDRLTTFDLEVGRLDRIDPSENPSLRSDLARRLGWKPVELRRSEGGVPGINENLARELLELHTLGVWGGYDQSDVIEVARALTGWGVMPTGPRRDEWESLWVDPDSLLALGFFRAGELLFRADHHDAEEKTVLGVVLPAGGGIDDGRRVLDLLARHEATAQRVAERLAARFVADDPPAALVARLARVYALTDGDLREVVRSLVYSPEFWQPAVRAQKLKTPLELVVSALRALGADLGDPGALAKRIEEMGQPLYDWLPPTGYPDREATWVQVGGLRARLRFAIERAYEWIPEVRIDARYFTPSDGPPDSFRAAVLAVHSRLLPERRIAPAGRLAAAVDEPDAPSRRIRDATAAVIGSPAFQVR